MKTGLVSVTFRPLSPEEIITLVREEGLDGIEWGGDIHVPPADLANAEKVGTLTKANGLQTLSYGSYFRAGYMPEENFAAEVAAAKALNAPNIRIWAGKKGSKDEDDRTKVINSIRNCSEICRQAGMTLSLEFHGGTLTDHYTSALQLVNEVAHENLRLYWQPNQNQDEAYNKTALRTVLPYVNNVHVFTWAGKEKFPLANGERIWKEYLDILHSDSREHGLFLEFVCDGTPAQFRTDARTLREWVASL